MTAMACSNLPGQLALSYSQPLIKSPFYSDIYTVQEEIDTNSNHISQSIVKQKSASLHRGTVRFVQTPPTDLSITSDLSNSKDSGIGSGDDASPSPIEIRIHRDYDREEEEVEEVMVEDAVEKEQDTEDQEEDEDFVNFSRTAKEFTDVDVEKLSWKERTERMDNCISWLREEIAKMKKQDQSLMRQFMGLRSTIHQLKRSSTQNSLRATYLRKQQSCANFGSDQSARGNAPLVQSQSRSSLHPLAAASESMSSSGNLSSLKFKSSNNLNFGQSASRTNLGSFKVTNSLLHLEESNFDLDTYFADVEPETDSFFDDEDSEAFNDHLIPEAGGKLSALSEDPYMPQYRTRTVSLVTPHYLGRPTVAGYLARSRYMSFSSAKGRMESERAILE
ncbi:uncharacterized protein [Diadema antillarum]|uniref:uncharacterized protein n=1 Tax=Diadema antillarum TaxID=105358 RepID=UPI003A86534F